MAYCAPLLTPSCSSAAFGEWLAAVTAGMPRSERIRRQMLRVRVMSSGLLADAAPRWGERDVVLDARKAPEIPRQKIQMLERMSACMRGWFMAGAPCRLVKKRPGHGAAGHVIGAGALPPARSSPCPHTGAWRSSGARCRAAA